MTPTTRLSVPDLLCALLGAIGFALLVLALAGTLNERHALLATTASAAVLAALCLLLAAVSRQRLNALRRSSRELERAQTVANVGSWHLTHVEGDLTWSAETFRIFGVREGGQVPLLRFFECLHPDDRAMVEAAWQRALLGEPYDIEHRIVVDGQIRWVHERAELAFGRDGRFLEATGTVQDITDRHTIEEVLRRSRQRLRALGAHHERLVEEERAHIAREIHDELGQYLTTLRMDAAMLEMRCARDNPALVQRLSSMKMLIDETIQSVRRVASTLRPTALDLGLESGVEWLVDDFQERNDIACALKVGGQGLPEVDDGRSTLVFRILQEALTNVVRHAGAGAVEVALTRSDGLLRLEVHDDGRGFDPCTRSGHGTFGLLGMHERAMMYGGSLHIDSAPGRGTTVRLDVPLGDRPMSRDEFPETCEGCPLMEVAIDYPGSQA
ncbi:MAG: histidine kinase [Zoogloeaceae bacterium]|nr:histidine kinase [Zoogloeaceae bacterium]